MEIGQGSARTDAVLQAIQGRRSMAQSGPCFLSRQRGAHAICSTLADIADSLLPILVCRICQRRYSRCDAGGVRVALALPNAGDRVQTDTVVCWQGPGIPLPHLVGRVGEAGG